MADDEDDREKYEKADQGKDWDGFGFIPFHAPSSSVDTLPTDGDDDKDKKPNGNVIPNITPSDELRLYSDLFAQYGTPRMVRLKALFAFIVLTAGIYAMRVSLLTNNPVIFCAAAGLVAIVGAAYIFNNTAG